MESVLQLGQMNLYIVQYIIKQKMGRVGLQK